MKDGRTSYDTKSLKFFAYDHKYQLESDYKNIITELKSGLFVAILDDHISDNLGLRLNYTMISSINKNQLALRLDQSMIVRKRLY